MITINDSEEDGMLDWESEEVRSREVRLFPTVRISSDREAELRATAALCAMIKSVAEFGQAAVKMAKGPAGTISCYTEVSFKMDTPDEAVFRPDAVIRVVRGKTDWRALVEVKVGDNQLRDDQVSAYQALVRQEGFDALITISNEAALADGLPPVNLDKRRLRSAPVFHLSWDRLLSEAQMLSGKRRVKDEDQHWLLEEWVKYVADTNSKIIAEPTLGEHWTEVLQAAREDRLQSIGPKLIGTLDLWDGYLRKLALKLRAKLGVEVHRLLPRIDKQDAAGRIKRLATETAKSGLLQGNLRIPDAVGDLSLAVNLQAKSVRFSIELDAPSEGRAATRINWLIRQLKRTTESKLLVRVLWDKRGLQTQAHLKDVIDDAARLARDEHNQPLPADALPRKLILEATLGLQKGRGRSTARVLDGISASLEHFYQDVVEGLVRFTPRAPKLPTASHSPAPRAETEQPPVAPAPPAPPTSDSKD